MRIRSYRDGAIHTVFVIHQNRLVISPGERIEADVHDSTTLKLLQIEAKGNTRSAFLWRFPSEISDRNIENLDVCDVDNGHTSKLRELGENQRIGTSEDRDIGGLEHRRIGTSEDRDIGQ
jgi:hypothetical protein